ncbi:MAG: hypothetical protein KF688_17965 [Pirellulales bacterium]|nr:hypothetical protein [Pirellulales bacterium]
MPLTINQISSERRPDGVRISAGLRDGRGTRRLHYDVPEQCLPGLTADRADAFVTAVLVDCMAIGVDISVEAPVSGELLRGLYDYQLALSSLYPELRPVSLTATSVPASAQLASARVVATGFSAGVDAFSTLYDYFVEGRLGDRPELLVFGNAGTFPIHPEGAAAYRAYQAKLSAIAKELELPIAFIDSNLGEVATNRRGGFCTRVISGILLQQNCVRTYIHQTGTTYADLAADTDGSNPLCDHLLSTDLTRIVSDGAQFTRLRKIERIANWPIASRHLHVCPTLSPGLRNCSRCGKCTATMLGIDMLGKRNEFREVFDFSQFTAGKEAYVARQMQRATAGQSAFWRELRRYAESSGYPLLVSIDSASPTRRIVKPASLGKSVGTSGSGSRKSLAVFGPSGSGLGGRLVASLLSRFGIECRRAGPTEAAAVVGGSSLAELPGDFTGAILGAGFASEHERRSFPEANILAVRGRLTADRCEAGADCLLADIGLLAPRLMTQQPALDKTLAVVPRRDEQDDPRLKAFALRYAQEIVLVNVEADVEKVLTLLARAEYVLSSSLDGLIAAEALGKPTRRLLLSELSPVDDFKFRDYYSAFDISPVPLDLHGDESLGAVIDRIGPARAYTGERAATLAEQLDKLG